VWGPPSNGKGGKKIGGLRGFLETETVEKTKNCNGPEKKKTQKKKKQKKKTTLTKGKRGPPRKCEWGGEFGILKNAYGR